MYGRTPSGTYERQPRRSTVAPWPYTCGCASLTNSHYQRFRTILRGRMMRRLGVGSWVLGLAGALSTACGAPEPPAGADIVKVIVRLSPVNFDPRVGTDEGSQRVHQLVYSHLLTRDDKLQV